MDFDNLPESFYAEAIDDLLAKIEKENSTHNMKWVAQELKIHPSAFSRARDSQKLGKKFGGMSRKQLLEKMAKVKGHNFRCHFDKSASKIICTSTTVKRIFGDNSKRQIYKVYYWRGGKMQIGVGLLIIALKENRWHQVTMLIDNQYPDFKNDDPYVLISTNVSQYEKNTYVDFVDTSLAAAGHRQLAIFHTPSSDINNRPIVEGVFATLTREHKPIAGIMLMEELTPDENKAYLDAELNDTEETFTDRRKFLQQVHAVPPIFYNALYGKRLVIKGVNLVSAKALPNHDSWKSLSSFVGIYEGHHVRTTKGVIQCFLLAFHENGSATVHLPRSISGLSRDPVAGQFKWVSQPRNTLTASFDYNPEEDHWRFRFILDGEDDQGCLYGIFAGTDINTGEPISGRVRLKIIPDESPSIDTPGNISSQRSIEDYYDRLRQIKLYTPEYVELLHRDPGLEKFFSGQVKPHYTDWFRPQGLDNQSEKNEQQTKKNQLPFMYAGDYDLYTLYRDKIGRTQKYFILKHPVRIKNDHSVEVKIRYDRTILGVAIHQNPVLKINFAEEETAYSHVLFTVNQLTYNKIDHVYGVLTGVHVENHRSEATIAVLVGNYSIKTAMGNGEHRKIDFGNSQYQEFEVGKKEFFKLDSGDPAKIATFISGHFNRYISPPATPNLEMQSRLSKYRLPYFKAACYAGLAYTKAVTLSESSVGNKQELLKQVKFEHSLFKEAMEEAFHHGFCDPEPQQNNSERDHPKPEDDVLLLLKELTPNGSMILLIKDVLALCDHWNRPQVRKAYAALSPELPLDFD